MLGDPSQSGGFLWDPESVSFDALNHGLEGSTLLVVICWIFATCAGVA